MNYPAQTYLVNFYIIKVPVTFIGSLLYIFQLGGSLKTSYMILMFKSKILSFTTVIFPDSVRP